MNLSLQKKKRIGKTKAKKNAMDISSCIDMTGPKSIARKTLSGMSATHKGEVNEQLNKTLKKKINREVKGVIVDIAHCELYLADCAVTGCDVGTASKPCFSLRKLWEYTLTPAIAQLVDTGGPYEGAIVVVQQDNAGPHIEASYSE